ncbi:peptidase [Haloterrigena salifodinae]|uniref:Peptidase n=1 Tax=Haloterrigena salifodinae TaxID=2675099 RepID=A0A8T8DWW6_9EURY|nr:peptidase [Haloterrigena salifodinae]QRV13771.1 peptidase [Haloterrigena salifodinae]
MIAVTAFWVCLLAAGYVGGRCYGWYSLRRACDDGRSRGTYRLLAVVGLAAVIGLAFGGLVAATERALASVHPALASGLAAPLAWLPTAAGAIIAVLVAYLGVFPYARERRDLEINATTAVGQLAKYLATIALFVVGALVPFTALVAASDPRPSLIPLLFLVLVLGSYAWLQHSVRLSQTVTEPTPDQRRRLEVAADRADLSAAIVGVIPGRETEIAGLYLDGPFWNRRAYATDYALEVLGDDELAALSARASAADDRRLLERRAVVTAVLFGLFLTLTVWLSFLGAIVALAVAGPLLLRTLQRAEFAADRRAVEAVGADALARAIEAGADTTDDRTRLHERLAAKPSRARRLEQLRER